MRYRVRHRTGYSYARPVDLGAHLLHLQPRALAWQDVLSCRLLCVPEPARRRAGHDCFGNVITWLFLDRPHARLQVTLDATVEVRPPPMPDAAATSPWEEVSRVAFGGGEWHDVAEFLFDSPMAPATQAARDYAASSFPPGRPVGEGLLELNARIGRDMAFRAGVTGVGTPVDQVLTQRAGVCQDFAHLMVAGLRGLGLPARYVSGYIRTRPRPGEPRLRGADVSHAWVGCWLGPSHGWVDIDPTNGIVVRDEHVVLGWGRDFSDVSPLYGVILGGGRHTLKVGVDLEPVEAEG